MSEEYDQNTKTILKGDDSRSGMLSSLDKMNVEFELNKSSRATDINNGTQKEKTSEEEEQKSMLPNKDKQFSQNDNENCNATPDNRTMAKVYINTVIGEMKSIKIEVNDKIIDIKKKIQQKTGLDQNDQILVHRERILKAKNLPFDKNEQDDIIYVLNKSRDKIKFCFQMEETRTSTLMFQKKNFNINNKSLVEYLIQDDGIITVVPNVSNIYARSIYKNHQQSSDEPNTKKEIVEGGPITKISQLRTGLCFIINNEFFKENKRKGTEEDKNRITDTFKPIRFEVQEEQNVKFDSMAKVIDTIKDAILDTDKILVVFVLSHGDKGGFHTVDGPLFEFEKMWSPFSNDKLEKLKGKPKLFFFVCCQGKEYNQGIIMDSDNINRGIKPVKKRAMVPAMADFFIGYSTCYSYVSKRGDDIGTPYIKTLCKVIDDHNEWSISDIHQEVQKEVSKFIFDEQIENSTIGCCQMPSCFNNLTEHAYLTEEHQRCMEIINEGMANLNQENN